MLINVVKNDLIAAGEYLAEVIEVTPDSGRSGPQYRWRFKILTPGQHSDRQLSGWTSTSASLNSDLVRWASACLSRTIAQGDSLDTDNLVGCKVTIIIAVKQDSAGRDRNKIVDLKIYSKINETNDCSLDYDPFSDDE